MFENKTKYKMKIIKNKSQFATKKISFKFKNWEQNQDKYKNKV